MRGILANMKVIGTEHINYFFCLLYKLDRDKHCLFRVTHSFNTSYFVFFSPTDLLKYLLFEPVTMAEIKSKDEKSDVILEYEDDVGPTSHRADAPRAALHHDIVAPEAVGGLYEELPKGYYWSSGFLGTLAVCFDSMKSK